MYNGVFPIFKEKGMTSHDVVYKMRKILHMKKVGHTGTLDPEVTGVLPVVVGEGTKLSEFMQTRDKSYSAEVTLGISTETEDAHGEIIEESNPGPIPDELIDRTINSFKGSYRQQVPLYSSVKVDGRKLYEYARKNQPVDRPVKTVFIKDIVRTSDIIRTDDRITFKIDVTCSKGTYIRTLAVDIGRSLGAPAHMSDLMRTGSCGFGIEDTVRLDELAQLPEEGKKECLKPVREIVKSENLLEISDAELLFKVKNGQKLIKSDIIEMVNDKNKYIVFLDEGVPIGMYHQHPSKENELKPYRMFNRL
ncbi:tRNA pseudouridine(55) synthase TruB [Salinicoccus kekensis]|uniref:tRNA pseudouridine synthase B n=1 Tax=Salinicoccus kekensis TaxID=714307 RepID=A0A285UBV0_9STAP|nr:tRNA pseudouridine(55) synthase TruB [Salinicoccus kekensis]SOC38046.1 tRNA pseudouridine synthase B [Salinicoccus kekensis]